MLNENEILMLFLGIGVLVFILFNMSHIRRIKAWKFLISAYFILLAAWIFTVLEGYFLEKYLNIIEHLCYVASSIVFVIWSVNIVYRNKEEENL